MAIAYTCVKQTIHGDQKVKQYTFSGAVLGTAGNTALATGLNKIKGIVITQIGTGTITDAPTVTVTGGSVVLYAAAATGYLEVTGT